jgi:glucose uptake protein GlcU
MSDWFVGWSEGWGGIQCMVSSGDQEVATIGCLTIVFVNMVRALVVFVGLTALVIFIFGAWKFMNSGGDPKKLESAKHSFTYGLLGLSIVLLSYFIITIIAEVTGVPCITMFTLLCF